MELQELRNKIVEVAGRGEIVAMSWEGGRREDPDGQVWLEITVVDHSGQMTDWYTIIDGELIMYDPERLAPEDRFPEDR